MTSKKLILLITLVLFAVGVSAQTATIEDNPESKTVTVGQTFSTQVTYSTNSVNSCTLGFVESSVPSNWEYSGQLNVDTTNGNSATVQSPKITAGRATEADLRLELECSADTRSPRDTSTVRVTANNPPFLEGELQSSSSIDVSQSETYTVTFSAANSGSSRTEAARAIISSPEGFDHPSSLALKEAGQSQGVIRSGKSTGTYSFDLTPQQSFNEGSLNIEFTSSEIGTTDSIQINLNKPSTSDEEDPEPDDTGEPSVPSVTTPLQPQNQSQPQSQSQTQNQSNNSQNQQIIRDTEEDAVRVIKNVTDITKPVDLKINPQSEISVKNIQVSTTESGQLSTSVRDVNQDQLGSVPEVSSAPSNVYRYQEINTTIDDSDIEAAEIDFRVERSWLESRNSSVEEVEMRRFDGESWNSLPTTYLNSSEELHNFEATSEGFSFYAIALDTQTQNQEQTQNQNRTQTQDKAEEGVTLPYIPVIAVLAILLMILTTYLYKDEILDQVGGEDERKQDLNRRMDEVRDKIRENDIDQNDKQEIMASIQRASSLIDQENYKDAEKILSRVSNKVS